MIVQRGEEQLLIYLDLNKIWSHITNLSGSPAEHVPVIIAQIGYHIAEDFPEGHHDPSHHCHRKEQHPEDAHHSLELRDDLERETE